MDGIFSRNETVKISETQTGAAFCFGGGKFGGPG